MSDQISDSELQDLLRAARKPKASAQSAAGERPSVSYDFKQPQPLNKELFRRLEGLHEQLARSFASALSSSMRMVVDIDLAFCEQQLYHEFVLSLPMHDSSSRELPAPPRMPNHYPTILFPFLGNCPYYNKP